jgi:hypothetical protein
MPGTLGQLRRNRRRIDVPLDDGNSIFIEYRPGALTEGLRLEYETAMADTAEEWEKATFIRHFLLTVIEAWDVVDAEGQVIPLTEDGFIHKVGYDDQIFLMETIRADADMGEANGANSATPSSSTSSPKARRATSRR